MLPAMTREVLMPMPTCGCGRPRAASAGPERLDAPADLERAVERALRVVGARDRRAEERHHAVAQVLVDHAAVRLDHLADHGEELVQQLQALVRREPSRRAR